MSEVPYGFGILSQGLIITSEEQHRLEAKKAWFVLSDYLLMNDERILAAKLPIPSALAGDRDVEKRVHEISEVLARFRSESNYLAYTSDIESYYTRELVEAACKAVPSKDRPRWVVDATAASNPLSVLDVGCGFGDIAINVARNKGTHVTAINISNACSEHAMAIAEEEGLPIEWVEGVFEYMDFREHKFDVVIAGEIIEHVVDPHKFLLKCVSLAKKAVVITTPLLSCEKGFAQLGQWDRDTKHVWSFSETTFRRLLKAIPDVAVRYLDVHYSQQNLRGIPIPCLCAKLEVVRKESTDDQALDALAPVAEVPDEGSAQNRHKRRVEQESITR